MFRTCGIVFLSLLLLGGCAPKVTRIEAGEVRDLSGRWNDSDSQMVAEAMIQDCLNRPWLSEFSAKSGKKPDIIVGQIRNRSSEHISAETFTKDLERALLNSGRASFVASAEERQGVREERLDMDVNAAPETRQTMGMEAGANFMLIGTLNSITDREGKDAVVFYQVNLELVDLSNNRKVWIGDKKIKKFVERARYRP
ncbi:MAG: penicillin-binding protein activator LpoB [Desulfuromonadales bacterium GWD2_61_12]|nr:MAG: penicillin-binding protein activator LpoB [Desulfuromonadales bacterium GWC2_61_20]OGR35299.1 MAG: penicillin-binding protein activator LpoB [Desulfuromonadales bacterium GWD2_61_12]HBT82150.1 penicillin-binding protein activator LpoB [Desulfuromonas sp.]